ncbi:MAG: hypothetical protein ACYDH9_04380 [Limisphaerales bacterium]
MKRPSLFLLVATLSLVWSSTTSFSQSNTPSVLNRGPLSPQTSDGLAFEVLAAGLGGFLAWTLTKAIGLAILRRRLVSYAVVVVNSHLRQYADIEQWLRATREKTIREGHIIKLAAAYTVDELEDLTELRPDGLRLLRKNEILRITVLLLRLKELEALLAGFCNTLEEYKLSGAPLKPSDVDYLQRKQDRIFSYMRLIPKEIPSLDALPLDYAGIIGADSIVTISSAELPTSDNSPRHVSQQTRSQQGAALNGGPAAPVGNSGVPEGPPSVM